MKRLLINLVSCILLLPLSEIQAEQGNKNSEGKISYIITSGENIRVEKKSLLNPYYRKNQISRLQHRKRNKLFQGLAEHLTNRGGKPLANWTRVKGKKYSLLYSVPVKQISPMEEFRSVRVITHLSVIHLRLLKMISI